jgi:predicted site-specific integrase-resolvase
MIDPILDRKQFAKASSLSPSTIERLWRAGRIKRVQLSDKRFGYRASELDKLRKSWEDPGKIETDKS